MDPVDEVDWRSVVPKQEPSEVVTIKTEKEEEAFAIPGIVEKFNDGDFIKREFEENHDFDQPMSSSSIVSLHLAI